MSTSSAGRLALGTGAVLLAAVGSVWAAGAPIDYVGEARKAGELQKQGGEFNPNDLGDGPGDTSKSPKVNAVGCIPRVTGKMSLLGVEYDTQGSPQPIKGSLSRLAQNDPALVALAVEDGRLDNLRNL